MKDNEVKCVCGSNKANESEDDDQKEEDGYYDDEYDDHEDYYDDEDVYEMAVMTNE